MTTVLSERFEEAAAWAAHIHRTQERKGGAGIPYVSHLFVVASLVLEDGGNEDEAIAALLHDAVEDRAATIDEIRERFGETVAGIVLECSDAITHPKPPWQERKHAYLDGMAHKSEGALRVSNADKVHNARCILADYREHGDALWKRFNTNSAADQLWYYEQLTQAFEQWRPGNRLTEELRRIVDELKSEVG